MVMSCVLVLVLVTGSGPLLVRGARGVRDHLRDPEVPGGCERFVRSLRSLVMGLAVLVASLALASGHPAGMLFAAVFLAQELVETSVHVAVVRSERAGER